MPDSNLKSEGVSATHLEAGSDALKTLEARLKYDKHGNPLVPQPIDDANDPLNWSALRKVIIITIVAAWTFLGTLHMIIVGSAFFKITAEFQNNFNLTTYLVGGPLLSYGLVSLVWVAAGNRFGVRLCFFLSAIVAGCFSVWGAEATTFSQLVAARTLASMGYASPETLGPQVVADVFFLKDRAKCMAFITGMQACGFAIGPLVGGFIVEELGWRWTQWIMAILSFSLASIIFCLFPETQYTADISHAVKKRSLAQEIKFTSVSGGGRVKVHRYHSGFPIKIFVSLLIFMTSFLVAFLYPFRYLRHPIVVMVTIYFSLYLLVNSYLLVRFTISLC